MVGVTLPGVLAAPTQNRVPLLAAAVLCVLTSGCLLNTKTGEGRALHDAPGVLARAQSVGISLTVASRLVKPGSLTSNWRGAMNR